MSTQRVYEHFGKASQKDDYTQFYEQFAQDDYKHVYEQFEL